MRKPVQDRGRVANGVVVLDKRAAIPEGTRVVVTPEELIPGTSAAILAGMRALPRVDPADVDEMMRNIDEGKRPISYRNPLARRPRK